MRPAFRVFMAVAALIWFILGLAEIGAQFSWWTADPLPHWLIGIAFICTAGVCASPALTNG